ncbi:MAG TPA: hypothetical protein DDW21_02805 [Verrucomicrobiales bacterium]|nr:hypothetical protein [Verrucomicrobiales bacterium]
MTKSINPISANAATITMHHVIPRISCNSDLSTGQPISHTKVIKANTPQNEAIPNNRPDQTCRSSKLTCIAVQGTPHHNQT